jgi:hypothetical protein
MDPSFALRLASSTKSRNHRESRIDWIRDFNAGLEAKGREILAREWNRKGAFEDEQSIRMLVEAFNSVPVLKVEDGKFFRSVPLDWRNRYSVRRWKPYTNFHLNYNQRDLFPVHAADNRPEDVPPPPPETILSDILLYEGHPYFVESTAHFLLNPRYRIDASKPDLGCEGLPPFSPIQVAALMAYSGTILLGAIVVIFYSARALLWILSRRRKLSSSGGDK